MVNAIQYCHCLIGPLRVTILSNLLKQQLLVSEPKMFSGTKFPQAFCRQQQLYIKLMALKKKTCVKLSNYLTNIQKQFKGISCAHRSVVMKNVQLKLASLNQKSLLYLKPIFTCSLAHTMFTIVENNWTISEVSRGRLTWHTGHRALIWMLHLVY